MKSFSFSISIARLLHFTFHSRNEWTRFSFHFSLLEMSEPDFHFTSQTSNIHSRRTLTSVYTPALHWVSAFPFCPHTEAAIHHSWGSSFKGLTVAWAGCGRPGVLLQKSFNTLLAYLVGSNEGSTWNRRHSLSQTFSSSQTLLFPPGCQSYQLSCFSQSFSRIPLLHFLPWRFVLKNYRHENVYARTLPERGL